MKISDPDALALSLSAIAWEAGRLLCGMQKSVCPHLKADGSPTTLADLAAEKLIMEYLQSQCPEIAVIAEETASHAAPTDLFFLVDPLDGTKDYIQGMQEFTVNIALVKGRRPIAATIVAPMKNRLWIAGTIARGGSIDATGMVRWRKIRTRSATKAGLNALVSRHHMDKATESCLEAFTIMSRRPISSALKFALLAEGESDLYVRCGPTMEWDTAAGDHILTKAGGIVVDHLGQPLSYGHFERAYRNGPFAALADPTLAPQVVFPSSAIGCGSSA